MPMTRRERKAALVNAGVTQADIARATKLSQAFVSDVIAGFRRSDVVETLVARAIGKPVDEVFEPRGGSAVAVG
ncbi:MAG TPA: helix-turn-helix transcriptional regulator [Gemmatimonadaceae bacterium]|nr:helix-turn-helix transcriptional regulator [Gemmatimonadaceae bacterium]